MEIQFNNWEKYQTRKDIKRPSWFAISNDLPNDRKLFRFTNEERLCFIFLLCEASKTNNNGRIIIDLEYLSNLFNIKDKVIAQTIEKMKEYGICTDAYGSVRDTNGSVLYNTVHNSTGQNRTEICVSDETPQSALRVTNSELEAIYSEYPKRLGNQGKADAFKSLISLFSKDTSLGIYQDVLCAVRAYKSFCSRNGLIGTEKVAMFSTFFGKKQLWKDWVGPQTSHQPTSMTDEEFRRLAFGGTSEQP